MRRASAILIALALAAPAFAKHRHPKPEARGPTPEAHDPRPDLSSQLAAESDTLAKTLATVSDKLAAADRTRLARLRAATRMLASPETDPMAAARRRVAARYLLDRDASERALLADEAARLRASEQRTTAAAAELANVAPPAELLRPADGKIARHFGTFEHDRSKAVLSRRGIDIEVDEHAPVVAPADGVVRYTGPIRGLDHGAILDHGTYWTVIAKLAELSLPVGTRVARGDRLGRAAHHRVYVELRLKVGPGGLPIDPEPLLK